MPRSNVLNNLLLQREVDVGDQPAAGIRLGLGVVLVEEEVRVPVVSDVLESALNKRYNKPTLIHYTWWQSDLVNSSSLTFN